MGRNEMSYFEEVSKFIYFNVIARKRERQGMHTTDKWLSSLTNWAFWEHTERFCVSGTHGMWYMDSSGEECKGGLHIPVVPGKMIKHSFREAV